jgi:hypothetical protein
MEVEGFYVVLDSESFKSGDGQRTANTGHSFTNDLLPALDNLKGELEMAVVEVSLKSVIYAQPTNQVISCDLIEKYQFGASKCQHLRTFFEVSPGVINQSHPEGEGNYRFDKLDYYPLQRGIFDRIHIDIQPLFTITAQSGSPWVGPPKGEKSMRTILRLHIRKIAKKQRGEKPL